MAEMMTGAYVWIEKVEDPKVQEVAKFAVTEKNRQASWHLYYKCVVQGWTQVVCGINYKLISEARHDGVVTKYEAAVYDDCNGEKQLHYLKPFKPILTGLT